MLRIVCAVDGLRFAEPSVGYPELRISLEISLQLWCLSLPCFGRSEIAKRCKSLGAECGAELRLSQGSNLRKHRAAQHIAVEFLVFLALQSRRVEAPRICDDPKPKCARSPFLFFASLVLLLNVTSSS